YIFFSSRRRHTSFSRDWSSDVCSSDLFQLDLPARGVHHLHVAPIGVEQVAKRVEHTGRAERHVGVLTARIVDLPQVAPDLGEAEIGRASCRERVWRAEMHGPVTDKTNT